MNYPLTVERFTANITKPLNLSTGNFCLLNDERENQRQVSTPAPGGQSALWPEMQRSHRTTPRFPPPGALLPPQRRAFRARPMSCHPGPCSSFQAVPCKIQRPLASGVETLRVPCDQCRTGKRRPSVQRHAPSPHPKRRVALHGPTPHQEKRPSFIAVRNSSETSIVGVTRPRYCD